MLPNDVDLTAGSAWTLPGSNSTAVSWGESLLTWKSQGVVMGTATFLGNP